MHDALESYTQKLYRHSIREWPLPGCFQYLSNEAERIPLGWQALYILSSNFREPWPEKLDDLPKKWAVLFRYLVARFELPNADYEQWTEAQYGKWGEDNLAGLLESWGPKTVTGAEQFSFEFEDDLSFRYAYPQSWTFKHMVEEARRVYELCGLRLDLSVCGEDYLLLAQRIPIPEVWHSILAVRSLYERHLGIARWILSQPDCDAGSAVSAMLTLSSFSEGSINYDPRSPQTELYYELDERLRSDFYKTGDLVNHYPSHIENAAKHLRPKLEDLMSQGSASEAQPPRGTLFYPDAEFVSYGGGELCEAYMSGDRTPAASAILSDLPKPSPHNSIGNVLGRVRGRILRSRLTPS